MLHKNQISKLVVSAAVAGFVFYGCIKEDDGSAPALNLPSIAISDLNIKEGDVDATYELELKLSGENKTNAVVSFSGIAGSAEAGIDFEILTKSPIIFSTEDKVKTIQFKIIGDEVKEIKESFKIKLYNPLNVTVPTDVANISIEDDDDNNLGLVIPSAGYTTPTSYPGLSLIWADEFNADTLNKTNWSFETGDGCPGNCGWGNNELQYYREDNTSLVDGKLVITAKKQNYGNKEYTSSRLVTKGKKVFKFGRIDIRAAMPKGKGLWPALWMLGSNIDVVNWPACGEIDIMELAGDLPNRTVATVHYGDNVANHQYKSQSKYLSGTANFQDEFHVFSLNWVEDKIEFLVDDQIYHTITPASLGGATYPFNKNFFFIFNVAVGGNFPGNPDNSTAFPQRMIVDYVRVFK